MPWFRGIGELEGRDSVLNHVGKCQQPVFASSDLAKDLQYRCQLFEQRRCIVLDSYL